MNTFLNERGGEIVKELEESISDGLAEIFIDITNNIFSKLPTDFWLPKIETTKNADNSEDDKYKE